MMFPIVIYTIQPLLINQWSSTCHKRSFRNQILRQMKRFDSVRYVSFGQSRET
ncbi:hypothetical protein AG1IA_05000 [Rhizoctonia solani AG-1 IA]|uniref:Uncharacterized protein n=1 Tax=Thanatephorus cucumeris (strain AG1-IA) TaxID=983506 RepID=L8WSL3_THACA|nr:hypothetical protein AG1IA_05000 [Rhizoctonia solani AG-1 IA]